MGKVDSAPSFLRDVEVSAAVVASPGASHILPLDLALNAVVVCLSSIAAGIQFHADRVGAWVERAFADLNSAGTRIDRSTQMAAIPFQLEHNLGLPGRTRAPGAFPSSSERIRRRGFRGTRTQHGKKSEK